MSENMDSLATSASVNALSQHMKVVMKVRVNAFIYSRTPHPLLGGARNGSPAPVPAASLLLAP